MMIIAWIIP